MGGVVSYGCVCTIRGGNVPAAGLQIGGSVDIEIYLATKKEKETFLKALLWALRSFSSPYSLLIMDADPQGS